MACDLINMDHRIKKLREKEKILNEKFWTMEKKLHEITQEYTKLLDSLYKLKERLSLLSQIDSMNNNKKWFDLSSLNLLQRNTNRMIEKRLNGELNKLSIDSNQTIDEWLAVAEKQIDVYFKLTKIKREIKDAIAIREDQLKAFKI